MNDDTSGEFYVRIESEPTWHDSRQHIAAKLADAVDNTPDPPCDRCRQALICAARRLVCSQFEDYISTVRTSGHWGRWEGQTATHRRYLRVYSGRVYQRGRPKERNPHQASRRQATIDRIRAEVLAGVDPTVIAARLRFKAPVVLRFASMILAQRGNS